MNLDDYARQYTQQPVQPRVNEQHVPRSSEREISTMPEMLHNTTGLAQTGVRGWLNRLGMKLSPSTSESQENRWTQQMNAPIRYPKVIAVWGSKGGTGKTITTQGIGSTLASHRSSSRVVGLDFDVASGLVERMVPRSGTTPSQSVASFDADRQAVSATDLKAYLSINVENFSVMPGVAWTHHGPVSIQMAREVVSRVKQHYEVIFIDLPGAEESDVVQDVLSWCDGLVYVIETTPDAIGVGMRGLDRIATVRPELLASTVVVLNHRSAAPLRFSLDSAYAKIAGLRTGGDLEIYELPFDRHVGDGAAIELSKMSESTRRVFRKITGNLMEGLPRDQRTGLDAVLPHS